MIYKLIGNIQEVDENTICVQTTSGVGYEVICTKADIVDFLAEEKENQSIYTYMQVREDAMVLFGFKSLSVKAMFLKLITISGIGPKMAISILSDISPEDLSSSIVSGDVKALSSVKGLGKKTAERIILELKEKVQAEAKEIKKSISSSKSDLALSLNQADSIIALCSLGLSKIEATRLVQEYSNESMTAEEIVTVCLKNMGR